MSGYLLGIEAAPAVLPDRLHPETLAIRIGMLADAMAIEQHH
jgi:hypothetical protein